MDKEATEAGDILRLEAGDLRLHLRERAAVVKSLQWHRLPACVFLSHHRLEACATEDNPIPREDVAELDVVFAFLPVELEQLVEEKLRRDDGRPRVVDEGAQRRLAAVLRGSPAELRLLIEERDVVAFFAKPQRHRDAAETCADDDRLGHVPASLDKAADENAVGRR